MKPQRQLSHIVAAVAATGLTAWINGPVVSFWVPATTLHTERLVSVVTLSDAYRVLGLTG